MEEDIKQCEELIRILDKTSETGKSKHTDCVRNLIARYKELYKENDNLRDTNKKLYEMGQRQAMQLLIEDEYIKKSKVKEKIEELNLKLAEDVNGKIDATYNIRFTIQVLEELLVLED